jgi:uncharacterized protein YjiS (DUF1127 family)
MPAGLASVRHTEHPQPFLDNLSKPFGRSMRKGAFPANAHGRPANVALHKCADAPIFQTGRFDLKEIAVMGLFSTARPLSVRERKIAALKSMSVTELADIGLKPGDVALLERAMRKGN